MRPIHHAMLSTAVGGAAWGLTGEPWAIPVAVGAGVLIDAEHRVDQIWYFYLHRRPAAILALHGWEWLAALAVASAVLAFPWWLVATTLGYGSHIASDHRFNEPTRRRYSFSYRVFHGFRVEHFSNRWRIERPLDAFINELSFVGRERNRGHRSDT